MITSIKPDGEWYHGSNLRIDVLRTGSTITQWKELAAAFAHQPTLLSYDEKGKIVHNGQEPGYLYRIDENVVAREDVYQHPETTMDANMEFLTRRPLRLKLIAILPLAAVEHE